MTLFRALVMLATLLSSLVAGFLFAFATVVMPGIRNLDDGAFIRAFQAIDGVIQRNQPLFILVWVGSAVSIVMAALMAVWTLQGTERLLLMGAALVCVLGVQAPTIAINLPLNGQLQRLEVGALDAAASHRARETFEVRWNQSNVFRTICATAVVLILIVLLLRL